MLEDLWTTLGAPEHAVREVVALGFTVKDGTPFVADDVAEERHIVSANQKRRYDCKSQKRDADFGQRADGFFGFIQHCCLPCVVERVDRPRVPIQSRQKTA